MKIIWSQMALARLEEIELYIAMDSPSAAENWILSIVKKVERLKDFPESGRKVPEVGKKEFRELVIGNYRIIYRREKGILYILTIRHFKQILPLEDLGLGKR